MNSQWPAAQERISRAVVMAADKAAIAIETEAIRLVPKGVSEPGLDRSIHSAVVKDGPRVTARVVCASPYGAYVEHGTGPAAGHGKYMPPAGALTQWVQRVLGLSDPEAIAEAETAVRWKLYMKGTRPRPFMKPAYDKVAKTWTTRLTKAVKEALRARG